MTKTNLEMDFALAVLGWVEQEFDLADAEMVQAFGIDRTTADRWRARGGTPTPQQRERMRAFAQLKRLLGDTFRTPEHGGQWLRQAVPALQGRTPLAVIADGHVDRVLGVLATHAAGVYV